MKKLLVTCVTSDHVEIVTAGYQFEAVEQFQGYYDFMINGLELSGYDLPDNGFVIPCVSATFTYKVIS